MQRTPNTLRVLVTVLVTACWAVGLVAPAAAEPDAPPSRPRGDARPGYPPDRFDLQAHRGGIGLVVESTLAAFGNALEIGVSTLELDVQITEDGAAVVTHDRRVSQTTCNDTAPAFPGDPEPLCR